MASESEKDKETLTIKNEDNAKGSLSNLLPSLQFASWSEALDVISKTILVIIGSAYIIGLLILNFHIRKYGVYYLGFLQIEYVMVGLLWAFLIGITYFFGHYFLLLLKENSKKDQIKGTGLWRTVWRIGNVLVVAFTSVSALWFVLGVISDGELSLTQSAFWLVCFILLLNVGSVANLVRLTKRVFKHLSDKQAASESTSIGKPARYLSVFFEIAVFLTLLSMYTNYVFPKLSPVFGGGKKQKAEFIIKADQLETTNILGLQDNNRTIGPLEVIFEGSDFFVIAPPEGFAKDKVKAIRIKKDMTEATLYFNEKK